MPEPFSLAKWYLDFLDSNGSGGIIYVAELCWSGLRMCYASTLTVADGTIGSKTSIRTCKLPKIDSGKIVVQLPRLGVEGAWEGLAHPIEREILASEQGAVQWNCLQPAARVSCVLGGRKTEGLGYAELLHLTMAPWKLPIRELHWGRFVSETDSLVWIDWCGPFCYRLLLHNGKQVDAISITAQEIQSSVLSLTLDRGLILRSGELGSTVFPSIRKLAAYVPGRMLRLSECKWRSRAVLQHEGRSISGWAIHEVVRWPEE